MNSVRGLPCKNKAFYSLETQHGRRVTKVYLCKYFSLSANFWNVRNEMTLLDDPNIKTKNTVSSNIDNVLEYPFFPSELLFSVGHDF